MYFMYVDESHNQKFFTLCGVIIEDRYWREIESVFDGLKGKYFPNHRPAELELKSYAIRQRKQPFGRLGERYDYFQDELSEIIKHAPLTISAVTVDFNIQLPPGLLVNELALTTLSSIFHNFVMEQNTFGSVICDQLTDKINSPSSTNQDRALKKLHYEYKQLYETFTEKNYKLINNLLVVNSLDNIGVQLADLCAYPILSKHTTPEKKNRAFDIISPKLIANKLLAAPK